MTTLYDAIVVGSGPAGVSACFPLVEAGLKVLAHARMMDYKPATALITAYQDSHPDLARHQKSMLIKPEDVPGLLGKIADLIAERATRRLRRELRLAGV